MMLFMLRRMSERDEGYELLEVTTLDDLDFATFLPMVDLAWQRDYAGQVRLDFERSVFEKLTRGDSWIAVLARARDGSPVGFELALERELRVRDHIFRAYYASVFTVSVAHRRRGLGRFVLEGINRLAFGEHSADLIFSTFHEGHAGSPVVQSTFDRIDDWGVARFHTGAIWSRRLDKEPLPPLAREPTFARLEMPARLAAEAEGDEARLVATGPGAAGLSIPTTAELEEQIGERFEAGFLLESSLAAQYLRPGSEASATLLYDLGGGASCLVAYNVVPAAINERRLRPLAQLQLLFASGCSEDQVTRVVHHLGLLLAERGCFALSLVDLGMVPLPVLSRLGFQPTEDRITFAARGPESTIAAFDGLRPPFFLDFT